MEASRVTRDTTHTRQSIWDTVTEAASTCAGPWVPGAGHVRIRKSSSSRRGKLSDPTYEPCIQAALIQGIANGLYKSIAAAVKEQNVSRNSSDVIIHSTGLLGIASDTE